MEFNLTKKIVQALTFHDVENNLYTIYTLEKGGPIISDVSLDIAKEKFENALKLSSAVRNLLYYEGSIKASSAKARTLYSHTLLEKIGNVEYHAMSV
jgi:hypothetical protein